MGIEVSGAQTATSLAADPAFTATYAPLTEQIWIPSASLVNVAGGSAFEVIGSSSALRWKGWSLDAVTTEAVFWEGILPDHWTAADVYVALANPAASAGNVVLTLTHTNVTDGGSMNSEVTDGSVVIAAAGQYIMSVDLLKASSAVAPNRIVRLEIQRDGGHGSDTLANDIYVMGVILRSTAAPVGWLQ